MSWKQYFGKGTESNVRRICCLVIVTQVSNVQLKSAASAQSSHPSLKAAHEGPTKVDGHVCLTWGTVKSYREDVELLFLGICFLLHWKKANGEEPVEKNYKSSQKAGSVRRQYRHCLQLELQAWAQGSLAKTSRPGVCKKAEPGCMVEACA